MSRAGLDSEMTRMTTLPTQSPPPRRPQRARIRAELGNWLTLPAEASAFARLTGPERPENADCFIFLGLGPDPAVAEALVPRQAKVFYLEAPAFVEQMDPAWAAPDAWKRIADEAELRAAPPRASVFFYAPNLKLFPSFWSPWLGLVRAASRGLGLAAAAPASAHGPSVLIPGADRALLIREAADGFKAAGASVRVWDLENRDAAAANERDALEALVAAARPSLFFSINFQGLDPYGERYHFLRHAGTRTAVWCVDNPWHLLQGLKSNYWMDVDLFVTDASFIGPLRRHGATRAHHLPLAVWPEHFAAPDALSASQSSDVEKKLDQRLVFVGRSEFPGKRGFFAGQRLAPGLWREAELMLERGERPDFAWWTSRLGLDSLWPDVAVRAAGYGAEEASRVWRVRCLLAAAGQGLLVYGDEGWRAQLGPAAGEGARSYELRPPVDYYGELKNIYAQARYTLNVTSLLLPAGLTQRHFDVWAAGGFLLTDATPGLEIFPAALTEPIRFHSSTGDCGIAATLARLESDAAARRELRAAWRALLFSEHTYAQRMSAVLERVLK